MIESGLDKFVTEDGAGVHVDWKSISELRKNIIKSDGSRSFDPEWDNLLTYLQEKKVLTFDTRESWTITGGGFDLSPKKPAPHSQLYFTMRKDAEDYAKSFYEHLYTRPVIKPTRETV